MINRAAMLLKRKRKKREEEEGEGEGVAHNSFRFSFRRKSLPFLSH